MTRERQKRGHFSVLKEAVESTDISNVPVKELLSDEKTKLELTHSFWKRKSLIIQRAKIFLF